MLWLNTSQDTTRHIHYATQGGVGNRGEQGLPDCKARSANDELLISDSSFGGEVSCRCKCNLEPNEAVARFEENSCALHVRIPFEMKIVTTRALILSSQERSAVRFAPTTPTWFLKLAIHLESLARINRWVETKDPCREDSRHG